MGFNDYAPSKHSKRLPKFTGCKFPECTNDHKQDGWCAGHLKQYKRGITPYKLGGKDGVCECCGKAGKVHWDHDHTTGKFRGWLCVSCNTGLGKLGDSVEGLERAIAYLKKVC